MVADAGEQGPGALAELMPVLVGGGVAAASSNGILGDPRGDRREGEELLVSMVDALRERLVRWQPDDRGRLG